MTNGNNQSSLPIKDMLEKVQLGEILDQALEGFQVIDSDWRYVYVNKSVTEQGKKSKQELLGHTMMEVYPGIENTPLFEQMKQVAANKVSARFENEFRFPDGSVGWFQLYIHPWSNGVMIFSVDVTERKKLEEALAKKVEELEQLEQTGASKEKIAEIRASLAELRQTSASMVKQN